ncbi:MAG: 50S ribosomal protein L37ae [Nanoarchaeota archaeon]|nr:50S ribosomal protein L37ae [Nanoarchaeota archaeon]
MAKKATGSTKRFGARYGKTTKDKFGAYEASQRKLYKCPSCSRTQVKRESAGIWQCKKCGYKFASKAYSVASVSKIKTEVAQL